MQHSEEFLTIVDAARKRIKEIDVPTYVGIVTSGEPHVLIDVREESEWACGHLPGAIHLCKGIIERDIVATVPDKSARLILYCGGGFRSVLAGDNLRLMGYADVTSMDGGWRAWTAAGLPVEQG